MSKSQRRHIIDDTLKAQSSSGDCDVGSGNSLKRKEMLSVREGAPLGLSLAMSGRSFVDSFDMIVR